MEAPVIKVVFVVLVVILAIFLRAKGIGRRPRRPLTLLSGLAYALVLAGIFFLQKNRPLSIGLLGGGVVLAVQDAIKRKQG